MVNAKSNYFVRLNWWITHGLIKLIAIIIIVILFSYFDIFYLLLIILGLIPLLFNKQTYEYMVKYSFWMSKKIGRRDIAQATKTVLYRRFYRTVIFIVGLIFLDLGISGGKIMNFVFTKLGLT